MNARDVHVLLNDMCRFRENFVGSFFVSRFPVPDTIRLDFLVIAHNDFIFQRLERVNDWLKRWTSAE